jgi:hypothetical protein
VTLLLLFAGGQVLLAEPAPLKRTFQVQPENRTLLVPRETRTLVVPAEDREDEV